MLIFDQLKKDDPQLRLLAVTVFSGMALLLAGLWWVQVVSSRYYQEKLEVQSIRTVRMPAIRGEILDRDGRPIAENRPCYNIDLYLEDLSRSNQAVYAYLLGSVRKNIAFQMATQEKRLGRKLTTQEKKQFAVSLPLKEQLQQEARWWVSSNAVADLSARLQVSIPLDEKEFESRYSKARALPLPILANLDPSQVARFEEQSIHTPGLEMDVQSLRYYPNGPVAAHLLGFLGHDSKSSENEESDYNYRLEDFVGKTGIEGLYDTELRGIGGGKSVIVNNLGYRQGETIWSPAEPGTNVVLTIDLDIQKAAETALQQAQANVHGAVVVMDAQNGDVLAMASAPTYDPNFFLQHHTSDELENLFDDTNNRPLVNRAMFANYAPGSIFKIVVTMAALEEGVMNPREIYQSPGNFPMKGLRNPIGDTAGAGAFDFERAFAKSSNPYFITQGLKPGVLPKIIALGRKLHLGERTGLMPGQEARGSLPTYDDIASSAWYPVETAFLSIGQGQIAVTPLQIAVMMTAVATGGTVFYPRLVSRIEPYGSDEPIQIFPAGRVRDNLGVSARTLATLRKGMLADTESPEGTAHTLAVPDWRVAGKTGTAEVERNGKKEKGLKETWFVSFAPAGPGERPRYVVVATVEGGASGGLTCVPIARKIYLKIQQREQERSRTPAPRLGTLAEAQP
jgi:penicillin-binding protein 2